MGRLSFIAAASCLYVILGGYFEEVDDLQSS